MTGVDAARGKDIWMKLDVPDECFDLERETGEVLSRGWDGEDENSLSAG